MDNLLGHFMLCQVCLLLLTRNPYDSIPLRPCFVMSIPLSLQTGGFSDSFTEEFPLQKLSRRKLLKVSMYTRQTWMKAKDVLCCFYSFFKSPLHFSDFLILLGIVQYNTPPSHPPPPPHPPPQFTGYTKMSIYGLNKLIS